METLGNIEQIQQGEEWNLDKLLSASDREYIPYLISNKLLHPFFVVSVASTKFEKNLRYVKSWWNDIKSGDSFVKRFFNTDVVYVGEQYYNDDGETLCPLPATPGIGLFSYADRSSQIGNVQFTDGDNNNYSEGDLNVPMNALFQYTKANEEIDPQLGHKPYHYFCWNYTTLNEETGKWNIEGRIDPGALDLNYECHVRFNFDTSITQEWGAQNYIYQITLVEGRLIDDVLEAIHAKYPAAQNWPDTIIEKYDYVKANWPKELQPDIDRPETNNNDVLGAIDLAIPILQPTKLEVFNNTRTII